MKHLGYILLSVIALAACKEHRPDEEFVLDTGNSDTTTVVEKKYKGIRVYQGKIPCADCSGIEQQLVLKGDSAGIYRLTEIYKDATEDGDSELVSSGEWRRTRSGSSYQYYLSEKNLKDSIRVIRYKVDNGDIVMLGIKSDSTVSVNNYRLKLVKAN